MSERVLSSRLGGGDIALRSVTRYLAGKWLSRGLCNGRDDVDKGGSQQSKKRTPASIPTPPLYLCNDAAELRSVLGEGQQVADGAADGLDVVRRLDLLDQDLWQHIKKQKTTVTPATGCCTS